MVDTILGAPVPFLPLPPVAINWAVCKFASLKLLVEFVVWRSTVFFVDRLEGVHALTASASSHLTQAAGRGAG